MSTGRLGGDLRNDFGYVDGGREPRGNGGDKYEVIESDDIILLNSILIGRNQHIYNLYSTGHTK